MGIEEKWEPVKLDTEHNKIIQLSKKEWEKANKISDDLKGRLVENNGFLKINRKDYPELNHSFIMVLSNNKKGYELAAMEYFQNFV